MPLLDGTTLVDGADLGCFFDGGDLDCFLALTFVCASVEPKGVQRGGKKRIN